VRIAAARALHVSGRTKDAVALLMQAIEDENEFVRHAALNEIGAAGVATKDLIEKMDKQNVYIRDLAAHALQQFAQ
jgi:HEAT repeat protein